jgi:ribonuclease/clavin/mitogillin
MWDHTPAPGVRVIALRTPTLPPATATNAVVIGHDERWIVDPATPHPAERERLLAALGSLRGLAGIMLTHHHRDHVGAAVWLAERLQLPIAAHPSTPGLVARLTREESPVLQMARPLVEGQVLVDGWLVLHTPGHASDHLCLYDAARGIAIVGDMVASVGTIVVDPPDGHMRTYLAQLERLRGLGAELLIPAHGDPVRDPHGILTEYIAHRAMRESRILASLTDEPQALGTVTRRSYPELDPRLLPLAERACLAHLEKLYEEGCASIEVAADAGAVPAMDRVPLRRGNLWRRS